MALIDRRELMSAIPEFGSTNFWNYKLKHYRPDEFIDEPPESNWSLYSAPNKNVNFKKKYTSKSPPFSPRAALTVTSSLSNIGGLMPISEFPSERDKTSENSDDVQPIFVENTLRQVTEPDHSPTSSDAKHVQILKILWQAKEEQQQAELCGEEFILRI